MYCLVTDFWFSNIRDYVILVGCISSLFPNSCMYYLSEGNNHTVMISTINGYLFLVVMEASTGDGTLILMDICACHKLFSTKIVLPIIVMVPLLNFELSSLDEV